MPRASDHRAKQDYKRNDRAHDQRHDGHGHKHLRVARNECKERSGRRSGGGRELQQAHPGFCQRVEDVLLLEQIHRGVGQRRCQQPFDCMAVNPASHQFSQCLLERR